MAKVLVLYYSSWGHIEAMAKAAVGEFPRPDRCLVGLGRVDRQGRLGDDIVGHPAWRSGIDNFELPYGAAASWHADCGPALFVRRAVGR